MRWNCLSKEHVLKDWKSLHCCKIGGCNQQYHNLLHGEKTPEASINELETSEVNQTTYLHLLPIIVSQGKNSVSAVVFLDSRSDSTLSHSHPEPLKMTNKWVVDNLLKLKQKIDIEDLKGSYQHMRDLDLISINRSGFLIIALVHWYQNWKGP